MSKTFEDIVNRVRVNSQQVDFASLVAVVPEPTQSLARSFVARISHCEDHESLEAIAKLVNIRKPQYREEQILFLMAVLLKDLTSRNHIDVAEWVEKFSSESAFYLHALSHYMNAVGEEMKLIQEEEGDVEPSADPAKKSLDNDKNVLAQAEDRAVRMIQEADAQKVTRLVERLLDLSWPTVMVTMATVLKVWAHIGGRGDKTAAELELIVLQRIIRRVKAVQVDDPKSDS